jgi:hypothetical protein
MVNTMATGSTTNYDIPFPLSSDPVNVHEDIQSLAEAIEALLTTGASAYHTLDITNNSGASIAKGDPVYISGYGTSKPTVAKSVATNLATFPVIGLAATSISNSSDGVIILSGVFSNINTNSYNVGDKLYVATSGGLTITQPTTGSGVVAVVLKKNASSGIILVEQPKGNGTWGSLKAGLS